MTPVATVLAQPHPASADLSGEKAHREARARTEATRHLVLVDEQAQEQRREAPHQQLLDHERHDDIVA